MKTQRSQTIAASRQSGFTTPIHLILATTAAFWMGGCTAPRPVQMSEHADGEADGPNRASVRMKRQPRDAVTQLPWLVHGGDILTHNN